jgi:hypothetical protein
MKNTKRFGGIGVKSTRRRETARHQQRPSSRYGSIYGELVKIVRTDEFLERNGSVVLGEAKTCFGRHIRRGDSIPDDMLQNFGKSGCVVKSGVPIDMSDNLDQDSDEDDVWNYTFNFANISISVYAQEGTALYNKLIDIKRRFNSLEVGRGRSRR